jgi:hypothetical protein
MDREKDVRDYKPLNLVTPQDMYPMSIPEELFDNIGDLNIFTIVDLKQSFNQIVLMSQPHFETSVRMRLALPKSGNLESSGTPKNSELNFKGQNTLP